MAAPAIMSVAEVVARYGLEPHPEGGYYRRWYESDMTMSSDLPGSKGWTPGTDVRKVATAIHYLCPSGATSALHLIPSDELWVWNGGGECVVVELLPPPEGAPAGTAAVVKRTRIGPPGTAGAQLTHAVPGGRYFGAYCPHGSPYALVTCVVAPGFDFRDWRMLPPDELKAMHPGAEAAAVIDHLSGKVAASH